MRYSLKTMLLAVSVVCLLAAQYSTFRFGEYHYSTRESADGTTIGVIKWSFMPQSLGIPIVAVLGIDCACAIGIGGLLWRRSRAKRTRSTACADNGPRPPAAMI